MLGAVLRLHLIARRALMLHLDCLQGLDFNASEVVQQIGAWMNATARR